jgi:hypothetical protein
MIACFGSWLLEDSPSFIETMGKTYYNERKRDRIRILGVFIGVHWNSKGVLYVASWGITPARQQRNNKCKNGLKGNDGNQGHHCKNAIQALSSKVVVAVIL